MARVKVRSEFFGKGALIQVFALALMFLGFVMGGAAVGTVVLIFGLLLFFYGSNKAQFWTCGECGNDLTSRKVRICPTCKAELN